MRWTVIMTVAVVAASACRGGSDGGDLGGDGGGGCTSNDDCASSLVCEYGSCRPECDFDRDCASGQVCVAVQGDPDIRVCTLADEGGDNPCPEALVRAPDGTCREPCDGSRPCSPPRECQDGVCVEAEGCAPGATQACSCPDGGAGAQSCGDDGTWGGCECAAADGDADGDVDAYSGSDAEGE